MEDSLQVCAAGTHIVLLLRGDKGGVRFSRVRGSQQPLFCSATAAAQASILCTGK